MLEWQGLSSWNFSSAQIEQILKEDMLKKIEKYLSFYFVFVCVYM